MINNISNVDTRLPMSVAKTTASAVTIPPPPILGFKNVATKKKATLRVKKITRKDNIIIVGDIEDDYVDIVESVQTDKQIMRSNFNFFQLQPEIKKTKFLKNCYVIDYIQSPTPKCGLGTEAIKGLAEKAMFDPKADGRIVTFSAPVWKESSPALFFYKLGFRFTDNYGNEYMEECLRKNTIDIPAHIGMMYLPKRNIHKLLRYGELF